MNVLTCLIIGALVSGRALAETPVESAAPQVHAATGLTLELVADAVAVVPGRPLAVGLVLRPAPGFHTYWRQPGLVGLTPSVEWSWPAGISAGEMLWPEPQRGMMASYGVWCLKRDVCLVTPVTVPPTLDSATMPAVTIKAKVTWMACSRTCHPGTAELTLTLPVHHAASPDAPIPSAAALIKQTIQEQPIVDDAWKFSAAQHGPAGGFSVTITPPPGRTVPADAYLYTHQRLVDSNVDPVRHDLPGGVVRLDLALVEQPDEIPSTLAGELWSAEGWGGPGSSRLLQVRAPLVVAPTAVPPTSG
jgi:thiol:disulfide interchange protein DsbD